MSTPNADYVCAQQTKACWGEVKTYAFDIDLPVVTLCQGHLWALIRPDAYGPLLAERAAPIDGGDDA